EGHQPYNRAVAVNPPDRKAGNGHSLSSDLINVAAHIFPSHDAIAEDGPMTRLPQRKILDHISAGFLLVLRADVGKDRARSMGADRRGQWMVEGLLIHTDGFHTFLDEPLAGFLVKSRRVGEVFAVIAPIFVPAAVDDDDVALFNFRPGMLEILRGDYLPFFLRYAHHHGGAVIFFQRNFVRVRPPLDHMS